MGCIVTLEKDADVQEDRETEQTFEKRQVEVILGQPVYMPTRLGEARIWISPCADISYCISRYDRRRSI